MNTNNFTELIKKELLQLKTYNQINEIKKISLNGISISRLKLDGEMINDICVAWNTAQLFYCTDRFGRIEKHRCYRNYVEDVILKYCQNRKAFMNKFKINK